MKFINPPNLPKTNPTEKNERRVSKHQSEQNGDGGTRKSKPIPQIRIEEIARLIQALRETPLHKNHPLFPAPPSSPKTASKVTSPTIAPVQGRDRLSERSVSVSSSRHQTHEPSPSSELIRHLGRELSLSDTSGRHPSQTIRRSIPAQIDTTPVCPKPSITSISEW